MKISKTRFLNVWMESHGAQGLVGTVISLSTAERAEVGPETATVVSGGGCVWYDGSRSFSLGGGAGCTLIGAGFTLIGAGFTLIGAGFTLIGAGFGSVRLTRAGFEGTGLDGTRRLQSRFSIGIRQKCCIKNMFFSAQSFERASYKNSA